MTLDPIGLTFSCVLRWGGGGGGAGVLKPKAQEGT